MSESRADLGKTNAHAVKIILRVYYALNID